jgi:hypothetical protein
MRLKDVIRAEKADIEIGSWNSGHVSRSAFPLSRARKKNYRYGPSYDWAIVKFTALGARFRVLVLLNESKEIYRATLAMDVPNDERALCQHEFHASEPGWHCHLHRMDIADVPDGVFRGNMQRWPGGGTILSRQEFGITKDNAIGVALRFYRIEIRGPLI